MCECVCVGIRETVNNNAVFGGTKGNLKFRVTAEDTITDKLTVEMDFNGKKNMERIGTTNQYDLVVDASQIPSNSYTITISAKDDAGQPAQFTRLVKVDNSAPISSSIDKVNPTNAV